MNDGKKLSKQQVRYGGNLMRHWYWCVLILMFLLGLTAIIFYIDTLAGCVVAGFSAVLYLILLGIDLYYKPKVLQELIEFANRYGGVQKQMLQEFAIPYGLADPDGRMLWMNSRMAELTKKGEHYHKNISNLIPGFDASLFPEGDEETSVEISFQERKFRVCMHRIFLDELLDETEIAEKLLEGSCIIALNFFDITELSHYMKENHDQKQVVGLLYMDNYEEAMESVEDVRRSMLEALVDRRITKYVGSVGGICKKLEKDKYLLVMNRRGLDQMEADRFSVLEDVKTVNIGNSIHVTISIGIGVENGGYCQDSEAARGAMEMALARGGDQVVVKEGDKIQFYGGKTQRAEKNTRVRARVKAQALREMISSRDRVIVMGHKITDIDSLGASVGVCRAAMQAGKRAHIVLGDLNSSIRPWVNILKSTGDYEDDLFITHAQAVEMTNQNTVVVVVDTNRPSMAECEEILYLTKTVVVLDHHRQTTEKIEHASLSYIEPSASSACEMVAEILQYYDDGIKLKPYEADCIYAGIVIDTNNFVAKTGSRTFEAAAFLRKYGADVTRVRKAFRNDMDTYKARAEAVRHAEAFMGVYAISVCPAEGLESPTVVGAQAANELLNIIGVKASFVLTEFNKKIFISARAIDEVNVQIIMERLGGGGHMNIAGAQLPGVTIAEARAKLKDVLTQMTEEGAI
ncbi:MAG: DHH family phosphoesterase [Lachnospiraceae bacterium]|nr:DHH family phosphoesterase [Lachnospiraceae bacterium]